MAEMNREAYGLQPAQPETLPTAPNQKAIVFVNMYFPDIRLILENKILSYNEYKFQTVYVSGVLDRVKQVLNNFFHPQQTTKVQGTRSQISAQIQNVPLAWLDAMKTEEHRLYYQLEHMDELGVTLVGKSCLHGKVEICPRQFSFKRLDS